MTGRALIDQLVNGPDTSFRARLLVLADLEHLDGDGIGLMCRQLSGDNCVRDVLLVARLHHWSLAVLSCARIGDEIEVAGCAEAIDASLQLAPATCVVVNPARLEVWRRVAAGPDAPQHPCKS